jgi:iron complex outermembrane receptor protein
MYAVLNCRRCVLAVVVWVFLFAVGPVQLQAQSDTGAAAVAGTALDVAGKPIANAAVTAKNESTGLVRGAVTGSDGRFSVTGLAAGVYSVEASAPSFATSRRTG